MIEQLNQGQGSNLLEPSSARISPLPFTTHPQSSSLEADSSEANSSAGLRLSLTSLSAPELSAGIVPVEASSFADSKESSALSLTSLSTPGSARRSSLKATPDVSVLTLSPVFEQKDKDTLATSPGANTTEGGTILKTGIRVDAVPEPGLPNFGLALGRDVFLPDMQFSVLDEMGPANEVGKSPVKRRAVNEKIAIAAKAADGRKPWTDTKYEPQVQNGRLAGAAAVSTILQQQGCGYADSANVGTLSNQLVKQGWKMVPLSEARAGDVVYGGRVGKDWRKGGGNAHVGIVGQDGQLWHNQSSSGQWRSDSIKDSFPAQKYGDQVWVLRPPENAPSVPNPSDHRPPRTIHPTPDRTPRPGVGPQPDTVRPGDDTNPKPEQEDLRPGDKVAGKNARILSVAQKSVDRRLWAISDFANSVKGGKLGCAASVSEVLKASGYDYANSAGVGGLVGILKQHGWTRVPLAEARPGDVVYGGKPGTRWWEGGGNAHIGIVGESGKVYHNSSGRRRWVQDNLTQVFNTNRFGDQRYVMRPPNA